MPSEKKFGRLFAALFAGLAIYLSWNGISNGGILAAIIAAGLLLVSILAPDYLKPLNKIWFAFGLLLGKIVSPIVLGILFFLVVTPFAVVMRLMGRDELNLTRKPGPTHWKQREIPGPTAESFNNQF